MPVLGRMESVTFAKSEKLPGFSRLDVEEGSWCHASVEIRFYEG